MASILLHAPHGTRESAKGDRPVNIDPYRFRQQANGLSLPWREHDAAVSIDHKLSKPSAYGAGQAERAWRVKKQHQTLADP
jgi:hypothetical protein